MDTSLPAEQMCVPSACILRAVPLFLILAWRSELSCCASADTGALERYRVPVPVLFRRLTRVVSTTAPYCLLLPHTAPCWPLLPRAAPVLPHAAPLLPRATPQLPLV